MPSWPHLNRGDRDYRHQNDSYVPAFACDDHYHIDYEPVYPKKGGWQCYRWGEPTHIAPLPPPPFMREACGSRFRPGESVYNRDHSSPFRVVSAIASGFYELEPTDHRSDWSPTCRAQSGSFRKRRESEPGGVKWYREDDISDRSYEGPSDFRDDRLPAYGEHSNHRRYDDDLDEFDYGDGRRRRDEGSRYGGGGRRSMSRGRDRRHYRSPSPPYYDGARNRDYVDSEDRIHRHERGSGGRGWFKRW